ncbi:glycoside hydrolase family 15 protein [Methylobacterium sp. WL30]|uniref:glycoside hydrolase family 15 protein n=1 Tax=unclassified Methylobacterium TaxID=2615210 RepID=UPI0011C73DB5|nr:MULTISPECIES: glycoside hydrolase family 15 protein [unclassified Methylobacterium]TXM92091.1 glycoside hydrolase family 15 protein [Methylobacterium sp. WL116]TXN32276.1 glycoside hydrolase family 15 protein [Methylobacterium sp. WL93]TXN51387.1 glycoside hydrolase family 15 protein [Methylobacterium sp. WL119]TXN70067.1 glycoside hydrolase family 15 protein [Methylobacterium sp. WL30]
MAARIEDYALIGDGRTAALISRQGSVDWLCWPRFDASALFASLLGTEEHGFWRLAPQAGHVETTWAYREGSLVLETHHRTREGEVRVIDYMPAGDGSHLIRLVEGLHGRVAMRMDLAMRFDYGSAVPWVSHNELGDLRAISGPHKAVLRTKAHLRGHGQTTVSEFTVHAGESVAFTLSYGASHEDDPPPIEPRKVLAATDQFWRDWSDRCAKGTPWDAMLKRSLLTLKALIYMPTGGIVAAPTTSLPESLGGVRNWDYRFCWLRDSTFTLMALMDGGFLEEARAWRDWLQRAVAGNPEQAHILYGIAGERLLPEIELDWLPGYEGSKPVRVGNAAVSQFQLDVYGELFDALYQARMRGMPTDKDGWRVGLAIIAHLEKVWSEPDEGIWEVRGGRKHFVHSKVMAWVAFDRAIRSHAGQPGAPDAPVARWKAIRDRIHAEVCEKGFDPELNSFVQYYGSKQLDASLLLIAHMGFLPQDDPRVVGTVEAIGRDLMRDGFILRYDTQGQTTDGLPGNEGAFLPCTFWYADNLIGLGRRAEARALIERLIGICNDLGLVSEEYDGKAQRLVGNFPQAFTHVALVNTILNYSRAEGPAKERGGADDSDAPAGRGPGAQVSREHDPRAVASSLAPQ